MHAEHASIDHATPEVGLSPSTASDTAALFEPDTLLPSQHQVRRLPDSPYRSLVRAVLERALLDAAAPAARSIERADALAWFQADGDEPFSFRWVAFHLGFDPDWLRQRVLARFAEAPAPAAHAAPPGPRERITPMPRRRAA